MGQPSTMLSTAMVLSALLAIGNACRASDLRAESVAQLDRLGARLERDSENRIASVDLSACVAANAGLEEVRHLPHVSKLALPPIVDDVGLDSIGKVTNLARLDLRGYRSITDAGLAHVNRLPHLRTLALPPQIS